MSNEHEEQVKGFLQSMGLHGAFHTAQPGLREASISHAGITFQVRLEFDVPTLWLYVFLGYLNPRTAAPAMRRMLGLNAILITGCYFALVEQQEAVIFCAARPLEGLDLVEFKSLCDTLATGYWQFGANLIQEFQLDAQPR
jgi:hypothetical protein